jgi:hypothetical protein
VALVTGLFLGLVGSIILYLCDHPGEVSQPDWLCTVGFVLVMLAAMILGGLFALIFTTGVAFLVLAGFALVYLIPELILHLPTFTPGSAPA